jgi:hypothetical protein
MSHSPFSLFRDSNPQRPTLHNLKAARSEAPSRTISQRKVSAHFSQDGPTPGRPARRASVRVRRRGDTQRARPAGLRGLGRRQRCRRQRVPGPACAIQVEADRCQCQSLSLGRGHRDSAGWHDGPRPTVRPRRPGGRGGHETGVAGRGGYKFGTARTVTGPGNSGANGSSRTNSRAKCRASSGRGQRPGPAAGPNPAAPPPGLAAGSESAP